MEVKESLNKPIIKEVYLHPPASVQELPDNQNIDFVPPSKLSINAGNCKPTEDLVNFELENITREKIIPRVPLGHLNVYQQKQDNTVSFRAAYYCTPQAPIEGARPINDDFYQPILEKPEEQTGKIKFIMVVGLLDMGF